MKLNAEARSIVKRLEKAAQTYGEVFDFEGIVAAMKKQYELLGVPMPEVVCIENMEDAFGAARDATWDAARGAAWDAARDAAWDAAWDAARDAAWDAARGAARDATWGAARGAAWDAARDATWGAAWDATWDAARDAAWDAARGATWDATWGAARGAAWGAAWGAAAANTGLKDADTLRYKEVELCALEALEKGLGFYFPMQDKLILVPVPKFRLNGDLLHSDRMPAVEWKDGRGYYFLNGVRFPEELWTKVTSGKMPFQDILAIRDTDQRTQAMRYGNVWDFVKHAKGELLDEHTKFRQDGSPVRYWLYKFPKGEVFTEDAYYVLYDDLVPGSDKQYMSGVTPCKTVAEAMSFKFSDEKYTLTPSEWIRLIPNVHMN